MSHKILVNLPPTFHTQPELQPIYARLEKLGEVRRTSHDTPEQIRADLAWSDAVIMWSWPMLTDELLDVVPNLKFRGHIDLGQTAGRIALRRGVPTSLSKGGWSPTVAELALTMALSVLRRTPDYHEAMRAGREKWVQQIPGDLDPTERQLTGRSVGVIGFGAIGQRFAELLQPFRCTLRTYDPFIPEPIAAKLGAAKVELHELLRESEVVVIAAASNPGTTHLIGANEIAMLQKNAVLVLISRAALVDTAALVARLKKGDMFAAIEVFDKEPLLLDHPLRSLKNAYLTPHRAGGLMDSVVNRVVAWLVEDLEAVLAGKPQKWPLTERMLPSLDG